mmetsp:Transcript_20740/g.35363  ORF Transcript_20740/g.35363 Transcript_20740/m.35363 type:complete len:94 (-) Transcript_20740:1014-1295(-)
MIHDVVRLGTFVEFKVDRNVNTAINLSSRKEQCNKWIVAVWEGMEHQRGANLTATRSSLTVCMPLFKTQYRMVLWLCDLTHGRWIQDTALRDR